MLYAVLKPLVRSSLRLFYRRINCKSLSEADTGGPLLLLANHSASFMDAFVVACFLGRRIHFFARGDVFRGRFAEKLLRAVGIMPVFRQSEGRDKLHRNSDSHFEATEVLRQGGAVLIFCEGVSDTRKQLKPLKKGPFRLAISAGLAVDRPLHILPLGINYTDAVSPGGDVYLQAGAPIAAGDFVKEESEAGRARAATDLMRTTESALRPLLWHCSRDEHLNAAYALAQAFPLLSSDLTFPETQSVITAVDAGGAAKREVLSALMQRLRRENEQPFDLAEWLLLTLGAPFALIGFCVYWLPLHLASFITRRSVREDDFIAPVFLCCAIVLVSIWQLIGIAGIVVFAPAWWLLALPAPAFCSLFYLKMYGPLLLRRRLADRAISRLEALQAA